MRVTTAGENRLMVYGPKSALFAALLILSGCTQEEATASLRGDLQVDEFEIIHARFPCRSPDMHFFGYRFRIGLKGEYAFGDIAGTLQPRSGLGKFCRTTPYRVSVFANSVPYELKKTAAGVALAISMPRTEAAVIRHFQMRMPAGCS
jgi:hypothetical protein